MTVSAGTSDGFGPKSVEIYKITNGGIKFADVGTTQDGLTLPL